MNILIDGYNLLKQIFTGKEITLTQRNQFFQKALDYSSRKGHSLFIVFDGGSHPRPSKEKSGPVTVIYSGYKDSADDVIKHLIEEKLLKNLLVVTTDRNLNAYADEYDIPSIDSMDFYHLMMQKDIQTAGYKKATGQAQKLRIDESQTELDRLMQEGSEVLQYKSEDTHEQKHETQGSSKKEKRLLTLIKKL